MPVWWGKAEVFQLKMGCSSFSDGQPGWSRGCHCVKITMKILQNGNFDIFWWLQSNLAIVGHCHSCSRSHGQAQVTSGLLGWPEDFNPLWKYREDQSLRCWKEMGQRRDSRTQSCDRHKKSLRKGVFSGLTFDRKEALSITRRINHLFTEAYSSLLSTITCYKLVIHQPIIYLNKSFLTIYY